MLKQPLKKAIIPMAGADHLRMSLQSLELDHGGKTSVIDYQIQQLFDAGIQQVALIVSPESRPLMQGLGDAFGERVVMFDQVPARGFGHAILCAHEWLGIEPVLVQVCDHFFMSKQEKTCTAQLIDVWKSEGVSVLALNRVEEAEVPRVGIVSGRRLNHSPRLYQIASILEKPTLTQAEQLPHVPGLRSNVYLGSAGMQILSPRFMQILKDLAQEGDGSKARWLSHALIELTKHETLMGMEIDGRRINLEDQYGLVRAQIALALRSSDSALMNRILLQEVSYLVEGE